MSKANQKFVQADEAVSPVIGVILMVAITVVLAAVVFVLVSNLSKTSETGARITGFVTNDGDGTGGTFTLNSVEPQDLDWGRLAYGNNAATCAALATTGPVTAGTVITCTGNGSVTIRDTQANTVAVTFTIG